MEKIRKWLADNGSGDGDGYGSGYGDGYGSGDGDGYGSGYGDGYGDGSGDGSGSGSGDGSGYGDGYGDGSGDGDGSGSGYGDGDGYGDGSGSGYGDGDGYGSGYGDGSGVKMFKGQEVFQIDDVPTLIDHIHGGLAKGHILNDDFTLNPCYIAKGNGYFAHGKTAQEAMNALQSKIFENMNPEEAISAFIDKFEKDKKYSGKDFFEWHHYLTGSCLMGRESFVRNKGLDLDDEFTVDEFIATCKNDYGGEIIKRLEERWNENE